MKLNCQQLLRTRTRVIKDAPMLAIHIDAILFEARTIYERHGSPDGPGDDKAFKWYENRYNKWESERYSRRA